MAIIEKPLNVFEIANQLGYYEYAPHPVTGQTVRKVDAGRLCTHANINKWSKYKPVDLTAKFEASEQELKFINYGLEAPMVSNIPDLISHYQTTNEWVYNRPKGGESSPFRVHDFYRYNSEAEKFYSIRPIPESIPRDQNELTVRMDNIQSDLSWGDFQVDNVHFGAVIVQDLALGRYVQETMTTPIQDFNIVDISFGALPKSGINHVYAYVSETLAGNPINYYPLDGGYLGEFYFRAEDVKLIVQLNGVLNASMGVVDWTLNIINKGYGATLQNVTIQLRYGDNTSTDPLEIGEGELYLGNINIANGYSTSGTFIGFTDYNTRGGYMQFTHSGTPNYSGQHSLIIQ